MLIFWDWLNEDTSEIGINVSKLGLKPNAPQEAVEAYEEFCATIKAAELRGEKI